MAITMLAVLMIMAAYHPLSDLYPRLRCHRMDMHGHLKLADMIPKKTA